MSGKLLRYSLIDPRYCGFRLQYLPDGSPYWEITSRLVEGKRITRTSELCTFHGLCPYAEAGKINSASAKVCAIYVDNSTGKPLRIQPIPVEEVIEELPDRIILQSTPSSNYRQLISSLSGSLKKGFMILCGHAVSVRNSLIFNPIKAAEANLALGHYWEDIGYFDLAICEFKNSWLLFKTAFENGNGSRPKDHSGEARALSELVKLHRLIGDNDQAEYYLAVALATIPSGLCNEPGNQRP